MTEDNCDKRREKNEKDRAENTPDWSQEFLAWADRDEQEEGIDIEGNRSHWREFNF